MKTTVIVIRHEAPLKGEEKLMANMLNEQSRQRALKSGAELANRGYKIDVAYSSPQFRAIETLQCNLAGNSGGKGPIILSAVDERFGDLLLGVFPFTPAEKEVLIAEAAVAKVGTEEALLTLPQYAEKCAMRGQEGAGALLDIMCANHGKTIAVVSHGGSRIEAMVQYLVAAGVEVYMVEPGGTSILVFEDGNANASYKYLGNLGK